MTSQTPLTPISFDEATALWALWLEKHRAGLDAHQPTVTGEAHPDAVAVLLVDRHGQVAGAGPTVAEALSEVDRAIRTTLSSPESAAEFLDEPADDLRPWHLLTMSVEVVSLVGPVGAVAEHIKRARRIVA